MMVRPDLSGLRRSGFKNRAFSGLSFPHALNYTLVRDVLVVYFACSAVDALHNAKWHCVVEFVMMDVVHPKSLESEA
jgi:hypothetical protein